MHNPALREKGSSILENEMPKLLWDFKIPTDQQIYARRPDIVIVSKKREPAELSKIKRKRKEYQNLIKELKKLWYMKVTVIPKVIGALGTVTKGLVHGQEGL